MYKVGITGQSGFVGTHLYNTLGLYPDTYQRIPFRDEFFNTDNDLEDFVKQCDLIIHLAAMNRHHDPSVIYETNIRLVKQLVSACQSTGSLPHIIFSSSTQEERNNLYGKSKKEGRMIFEEWARENDARFTGLIIPNVFGPFGQPYYNSVVATFCHQLTHEEEPGIDVDGELKLIYVGELVEKIIGIINGDYSNDLNEEPVNQVKLPHTAEAHVSYLLEILKIYKSKYFDKGEMPDLKNIFDRYLFNTFLSYIDHSVFFPFLLNQKIDDRGSFVETMKLNSGGQVSFSTTKPGITRGNHFHTRKAERFAVIRGNARIEIRRIGTDEVFTFLLNGDQPSFVDMPVWFTHNITNIGSDELLTLFWISEHFNAGDPDTWYEKV
jgi:UDP-2-acetamido-2,6-beta-L-arabino-hexul-4-ose reductase